MHSPNHADNCFQVFFVDDKSMPGWCVVLKKEARGRRITSTEEEHGLGQEGHLDDFEALQETESNSGGVAGNIPRVEAQLPQRNGRRRNRHEMA